MSPAAIIAIIELVTKLAPPAIELVHRMVTTFEKSNLSEEEQLELLNELAASLKPMELKV